MKKFLIGLLALSLLFTCSCATLSELPEEETAQSMTAPAKTEEIKKEETKTEEAEDGPLDISGIRPTLCNEKWDGKTLKVLCVGNSFARNATRSLYQIASYEGVEEIVLGVLHIGGCSVQKHYDNARSGEGVYQYFKNTDGSWKETKNASLLQGLQDEKWDVITITSTPGQEGFPQFYEGCLDGLIAYLRANATNPEAQIAYHMSWAYPSTSPSSAFPKYGGTRASMYRAITDTTENHVMKNYDIDFLLPTGTAVESSRSALGEIFSKEDGYHLNTLGEYVAGYMFFASLTGKPLSELKYRASYISAPSRRVVCEAVNEALADPYTAASLVR